MTEDRRINRAQWMLATLIFTMAIGRILYGILVDHHLRQTAALFIGLPALLAIILALTPKAKSVVGATLKGLTIALLLSGIFLQEGFVCILMAAPLFYTVAIVMALIVQGRRKRSGTRRTTIGLLVLPLLVMSMEGTREVWTFDRAETVTVHQRVRAEPAEIQAKLASTPVFDDVLPLYLSLGFPRPVYARGAGLEMGDTRIIGFAVGKQAPAELTLQVVESRPGLVRFEFVSDQTSIADWLGWEQAIVEWQATGSGESVISWTIHYQRQLDPAWYFGPMERYAVGLAGEYLIAAVATP